MQYEPPSAYDLTRQARWEVEGVRRAAALYQQAKQGADPTTLPSGQRLLREIVPPLTTRIQAAQLEALRVTTARGGRPTWEVPIQLLPADVLALVTVCGAMRSTLIELTDAGAPPITAASRSLATSVKDEITFRTWIAAQVEANKATRLDSDGEHVDLLAQFKRLYPNPDQRAWRAWRRKMELARDTEWDGRTLIHLGAALIRFLVDTAPLHFSIVQRREGSHTTLYLEIAEATRRLMDDIEQRAALVRPRMMPMLIPPLPFSEE